MTEMEMKRPTVGDVVAYLLTLDQSLPFMTPGFDGTNLDETIRIFQTQVTADDDGPRSFWTHRVVGEKPWDQAKPGDVVFQAVHISQ